MPGLNKTGVIIVEGHVQGLANARALGEENIPVIVVDRVNCIARYSKHCSRFFYCPDYLSDEFIQFLIDLAIKENLKDWLLMPSNDHAVISIAKAKDRLDEFYKILTPDLPELMKIYDKSELISVAQKLNIPVPSTCYLSDEESIKNQELSFPLLTKGKNGLSFYKTFGKKAFVAEDQFELKEQLDDIRKRIDIDETFTQELIPYKEGTRIVSFTAFSVKGKLRTYWVGEKIREHPVRYGTATYARSIDCKELLEPSSKLLMELGYTGICEIEYILDPRDKIYKLIEINARTWLWVGLAKECGINYPILAYNFVNSLHNDFPTDYISGIGWINHLTDSIYSFIAIINGQLKISEYIRSFKEKKVRAVFSLADILPGIMLIVLSFHIAFKRHN